MTREVLIALVTPWLLMAAAGAAPSASQPASQPELDELTRRIISGRSRDDLPARLTAAMADAGRRLAERRDAGSETQALQQEVLRDLDALLQQMKSAPRSQQRQQSSARRSAGSSGAQARSAQARQQQAAAANRPATEERDTGGAVAEPRGHAAPPDVRRRWGELPQRQREELMQGYNEQSLPRYREWVERYYRTLAQPRHGSSDTQPGAMP